MQAGGEGRFWADGPVDAHHPKMVRIAGLSLEHCVESVAGVDRVGKGEDVQQSLPGPVDPIGGDSVVRELNFVVERIQDRDDSAIRVASLREVALTLQSRREGQ